jgi:SM-20-related protein
MKKEMLIDALIDKGWFYQENLFSPIFCSELLQEMQTLQDTNWNLARIGKGETQQVLNSIRTDSILWIDENSATQLQKEYLTQMNDLMQSLNRELFLGLKEFECHFAKYNSKGFYKKHLDQHVGSKARIISTVFYLNTPESGGELAIYNKEDKDKLDIKIAPQAGSFVCFLSNQIYHEVLPTTGQRFSITGWFRSEV